MNDPKVFRLVGRDDPTDVLEFDWEEMDEFLKEDIYRMPYIGNDAVYAACIRNLRSLRIGDEMNLNLDFDWVVTRVAWGLGEIPHVRD